MATYDLTLGGSLATPGTQPPAAVWIEGVVDFSKVNSGAGAAQNDVVQVVNIPANTFVLGVVVFVTKASTNAGTVNVGDGVAATRYLTGTAINAVSDAAGTTYATTNFFYTNADTIDIVQSAVLTVTTGVVKVMVLAAHAVPSV